MRLLEGEEKRERAAELARMRGWESPSWGEYYARHEIIDFDGISIRPDHPEITREFWYDDEGPCPLTEDPEQRRAYFMDYNLRWNFKDWGLSRWRTEGERLERFGCCSGYRLPHPFVAVWPSGDAYPVFMSNKEDIEHSEWLGMRRVELSQEDIKALSEILGKLRAKYEKRLGTYWKRFSGKVHARGYWANR